MKDKKQAVIDLKIKTCSEYEYKSLLVMRVDAIAILDYIEELEQKLEDKKK